MRGEASRGQAWRWVLGLVLVGASVISPACSPRVALSHTVESLEEVARAVLLGLQRRDAGALRAISLSENEFHTLVWPKLPTSRPERNVPWDYVWKDLHSKSRLQLVARVNQFQDRGFQVVGVRFAGDTTDYETFRVHRATTLTLRDRDGHETTTRLFGSIIEQDGRYKVFSYVVD